MPDSTPPRGRRSPGVGVWATGARVEARVWAARKASVVVVLDRLGSTHPIALHDEGNGYYSGPVPGARVGDRYRLAVDGGVPVPDPASRSQPDGVHGSSEIIDPERFRWTDDSWSPPPMHQLVMYELHVGTFSVAGSFQGVADKLGYLAGLGINAIELMPVAEFPGPRNWGYDGGALFAPAHQYGGPDGLRTLVNAAHRYGIAVLLDVVYNHLGPDGVYLPAVSGCTFSDKHHTLWGCGLNFDDVGSEGLRTFFVENALHWVNEYHIDGLRLDATQAIKDDSDPPFLAEFSERVRAGAERRVILVAEDCRNLKRLVQPPEQEGWGFDAVWADDFHHEVRRLLTGDRSGHFADYSGTTTDIATTLRQGWFFTGQPRESCNGCLGTDPAGLSPSSFILCLQNHDQVGNRAAGERLHHVISPASYRAASTLLLLAPEIPLLFMGQEWAASSPFQFFTAHDPELGRKVTKGRQDEFAGFEGFGGPDGHEKVPDPQSPATFSRSALTWHDMALGNDDAPQHNGVLALYRALLQLRHDPALPFGRDDFEGFEAFAPDDDSVVMVRGSSGKSVVVLARLRGSGRINAAKWLVGRSWTEVLSTESRAYAIDGGQTIDVDVATGMVTFPRAGAVVFAVR